MSARWSDPYPGEKPMPAWLAVLLCAGFIACLLLADHVGQQRRCDALRAQHSPTTTTYCPGGTR